MATFRSPQSKSLRRALFQKMLVRLALFSLIYIGAIWIFQVNYVDELANWIADQTSEWKTVSTDSGLALYDTETATKLAYDQMAESAQGVGVAIAGSTETNANEIPEDNPNYQYLFDADTGELKYRDLSTYYTLRNLKLPAAMVIYLLGCLVILFLTLNRAAHYFDDIFGAVSTMFKDKNEPVELPSDLAIIQSELNEIRERSRADELAAHMAETRKNELVAYLAHDIRTPLTTIIGYLALLHENDDLPTSTRQRYIASAYEKSERLEGLINEFFEITRYNLQAIPIERETINVSLFCEQVADAFYPEASARDITLSVHAPFSTTFFVDPDKMARALGNIVRNAVAYADDKSTIVIEAGDSDEATTISISNKGKEISKIHLDSIFEKFYREDTSRSQSKGGAGLGLAIAREIITAHEGTVSATSKQGITTFTIVIPHQTPA